MGARIAGAIALDEPNPAFAQIGDEVELAASGLDPFESYTLTVAGAPASLVLVEPNRLRFVVPPGASSGTIELHVPGDPPTTLAAPFGLTVVRPLDASIDPALGGDTAGYTLGSEIGDSTGPGPPFPILVPVGEVGLAIAAGSDPRPLLLQVVTDSTGTAQLDALTTAQALVFAAPTVRTDDPGQADARLATLAALPETAALAELVAGTLRQGRDYLDDAAFRSRLLEAIRAFEVAQQAAPARLPAVLPLSEDFARGSFDFATGYPRDLAEPPSRSLLNRLDVAVTGAGVSEGGLPTLGMKWNATEADFIDVPVLGRVGVTINPVDWIAAVYELNPEQFAGGIRDVDALVADGSAYSRLHAGALDHLIVSSSDPTRFVNLRDMLIGALTAFLKPSDDLRVPADRSGLYVVRQFSGAHFPVQDGLVASLPDGTVQSSRALALNLFIAGLDAMGLFSSKLGGQNRKDLVRIGFDVYLTLERIVEERSRDGALSADEILAIRAEGIALFLRKVNERREFFAGRALLSMLFGKAPKFFSHIGKVATVGKIVSRTMALWNFPQYPNVNLVQGVESTVAVVGNPWRPEITSFSPRKGHLGTVVTMRGRAFSSTPAENVVEFNAPLSTDPDALPARPAEVIESTTAMLRAAVPADAVRGVGAISVQRADRGKFWTSENAPPFDTFEVLPAPVVTALDPDPPFPGGLVRILGRNFSEDLTRNIVILRDPVNGDVFRSEPLSGSTDELVFRDPQFPNSRLMLRVQVEDVLNPSFVVDPSNEVPYDKRPAPVGATGRIFVTSYLDNVTPDKQITLREAIHIGAGTLGRPLTDCPGDPDGCERQHVLDDDGFVGPGVRETILLHPFLAEGRTISLSLGALPGLEGGDSIGILATVDGGGGNFSGLTIQGQTGASVSFLRFQNFAQHGIHLIDAPETRLASVQVASCGGTGILLEGTTSDVDILSPLVSGCTGPGLHLSGPGVQRVRCAGGASHGMRSNGGDGILLTGGTTANQINCGEVLGNGGAGIRVTGSPHNAIGDSSRSAILTNRTVAGNAGAGLVVESPHVRVFRLDLRGNGSHGIVIGGPTTTGVEVQAVRVGPTVDAAGSVDPNQGHGILIQDGASAITIGTRAVGGINEPPGSLIAGNEGFGILITGPDTTDVVVNRSVIGASQASDFSLVAHGNALGGVALQNGTHDNRLGAREAFARLDIIGHTTTAGVLIEGGAHDNRVAGVNFGAVGSGLFSFQSFPEFGNLYGVRIRDGAHGNVIGARGPRTSGSPVDPAFQGNWFRRCQGAGVLLESGGFVEGTQTPGVTPTPAHANVLINNVFGDSIASNTVGVLLRAGAEANRIGGPDSRDLNMFERNTKAGLWIDGYAIPAPHLANRVIGNFFFFNRGTNLPPDPLQAVPDGIGVLLTNASGHVIGGTGPGEKNFFRSNYVAIYDDQGQANWFVGNDIGSTVPFFANQTAGVILAGATGSVVGPNNEIQGNGGSGPGPPLGGVAIRGGSGNQVWGNAIGTDRGWTQNGGNVPFGVLMEDVTQTTVGALGLNGANVIGNNLGPGVLLRGPNATQNQIIRNWIGESPAQFPIPNGESGVLLTGGAHDNRIGDLFPPPQIAGFLRFPAGNQILGNAAHGVHVDGLGTFSNTITYNSISKNGGAGIRLENGGNRALPAPTVTSYANHRAIGTVDASVVPDGSLVQLFSDGDGEGRILVGEGPVVNGRFTIETGFVSGDLTATVTHDDASAPAGRTDTSEFSPFFPATVSLRVSLPAEPLVVPFAAPGEAEVVLLPLVLQAMNGSVRVQSIAFQAEGTLADDLDILEVALYRDVDGDGRVGPDDLRLADPGTFDVDDGTVVLDVGGVGIDTLSAEQWLVALSLSAGAPLGSTVALSVAAATDVTAELLLAPTAPALVVGSFPLRSESLTVVDGALDADADGMPDVDDLCPATVPGQAVDALGCSCDQLDAAQRSPVGDPFLCPEPGLALLWAAGAALYALRRRSPPLPSVPGK